jgi:hypothetical protein
MRKSFSFLLASEVPWHWWVYSKSKTPYLKSSRVRDQLEGHKHAAVTLCNIKTCSKKADVNITVNGTKSGMVGLT